MASPPPPQGCLRVAATPLTEAFPAQPLVNLSPPPVRTLDVTHTKALFLHLPVITGYVLSVWKKGCSLPYLQTSCQVPCTTPISSTFMHMSDVFLMLDAAPHCLCLDLGRNSALPVPSHAEGQMSVSQALRLSRLANTLIKSEQGHF